VPLSIVEHFDFKLLMHMLNPQYRLSSRQRLCTNLIPLMFKKVFNEVHNNLNTAKSIFVTADAWTDARMRAYFAVTAYMIDIYWEPKSYLLGCKRFKGSHTSENVHDIYSQIVEPFEIKQKITHIITDNASNMIAAFKKSSLVSKDVIENSIDETNAADISSINAAASDA
jgi:hypothetical protein